MWAGLAQVTGPGRNPENTWADLGPTYFLSLFFGQARPNKSKVNYSVAACSGLVEEEGGEAGRRRSCCHWPGVRLEVVWSWKTRG